MRLLTYNPETFEWNKETKTLSISEKNCPFDTAYEVHNPKTGGRVKFEFSHSTGPEFDPNTKYVYTNPNVDFKFEVVNDERMTEIAKERYTLAKSR